MSLAMFASCELLQSALSGLHQQAEQLSEACDSSIAGINNTHEALQHELQELNVKIEAANEHQMQCQQEYNNAAEALENAAYKVKAAEYELSCAQHELNSLQ